MTGYQRGTVQVGDLVSWHLPTHGTYEGRVLVVMPRQHSEQVARLTGHDPDTAWEEFGPLALIQCTRPDCPSCKGGWPGHEGWKHQVNECQLERADHDLEVVLF